jgi:hypothetical protein
MERMNRRETLSGATEIAAAATLPAQIAQARNFARHDRKQIPSGPFSPYVCMIE